MIDTILPTKQTISSILVLSAHHETAPRDFFEKAYEAMKEYLGDIPIGYGSVGDFADLNRNRPSEIKYDFVNFHLQPQVHTCDSRSIMDNLGSHQTLISSAHKFTEGKPLHISSVTFSADNTVDRRLKSSFAAWWTLLALRNLSGAASISFYQLTGENGIIEQETGTDIYEVLSAIKDFSPKYIFQHTRDKVILENEAGNRLIFSSELPGPAGPEQVHPQQ